MLDLHFVHAYVFAYQLVAPDWVQGLMVALESCQHRRCYANAVAVMLSCGVATTRTSLQHRQSVFKVNIQLISLLSTFQITTSPYQTCHANVITNNNTDHISYIPDNTTTTTISDRDSLCN